MTRRPGRKIEMWQINNRTGNHRRKATPGSVADQRDNWKASATIDVEIRLVSDPGHYEKPHFAVYGPADEKRYDTLDEARKRVKAIAAEEVAANAEPWREVIIVGSDYRNATKIFGVHFARATISGERIRYWVPGHRCGSYGTPEPLSADEQFNIPWDPKVWAKLMHYKKLQEWAYEQRHGHEQHSYGYWHRRTATEETEEQKEQRKQFLLDYVDEAAKMVRRLQADRFVDRVRVCV